MQALLAGQVLEEEHGIPQVGKEEPGPGGTHCCCPVQVGEQAVQVPEMQAWAAAPPAHVADVVQAWPLAERTTRSSHRAARIAK